MPRPPVTLTVDLLTLKVVSESRVTWATSMSVLVFLGLSVLDLVRDRQTSDRQTSDVRQHHCLMPPPMGIIIMHLLVDFRFCLTSSHGPGFHGYAG